MSDVGDLRPALLFRVTPQTSKFTPLERKTLRSFLSDLSDQVIPGHTFTCLITSDKELHRLNLAFLRHDYATDVLSFPGSEPSGTLGDIAVSAERAEAQALTFGHSRLAELQILILHGVLHLSGLNHERDNGEMARAERKWRDILRLPPTLLSRGARP